jgi:multicomponent Na+:H+ antiporter subunit D
MPYTFGLYMVGALSISGLPLFNGYISKSMTISAAGYAHIEGAQLMLLLASVGTFLSVGLKLPWFTWFDKKENDINVRKLPWNMYVAMGMAAFACIFYGLYPTALYTYLPFDAKYDPFTIYHFVEVMQISAMTLAGFWLLKKKLGGELIIALDVDWFYRKAAPGVRKVFVTWVDNFYDRVEDGIIGTAKFLTEKFKNPMIWLNPFTDRSNKADGYSPAMDVVMSFIMLTFVVIAILYIL